MNTINTEQLINFLLSQQQQEKTIDIGILQNLFYEHLKLHNRTGTLNSYRESIKPLLKFFMKERITKTNEVTTEVINQFIKQRINIVKNQTINKTICDFKTMLNFAIKNKYIDKLNFEFTKLKVNKTKIESIKANDINKIIKCFETPKYTDKNKLVFLLMLSTGIRTTELINIKTINVDIKKRIILLDYTKNGKQRSIFIKQELIPLIQKIYNKNNVFLFSDEFGNQTTDKAVRSFFKRIKKDLDIEILSPHKLRHYYATSIYNNSLDIYLTSNLLGHSDIKMTQIYLDINNENYQYKNDIYNPLNNVKLVF